VVVINPALCNAASIDGAGLLVPSTDMVVDNSAAQPPTSATRSIDLDVVESGGCPNVFTIGARLSPRFGEVHVGVAVNYLPIANGLFVDIPGLEVILPEAGTYSLDADVRAAISMTRPANVLMAMRMFNVTAGAAVPFTDRVTSLVDSLAGGVTLGGNFQLHSGRFITVAGPTTIRVQAAKTVVAGVAIASTGVFGQQRLAFLKVAD